MVYQLNQTTQMGKLTEEMLKKLTNKKDKKSAEPESKVGQTHRNLQINREEINKKIKANEKVKEDEKHQVKTLHKQEYDNLKERDHRLALCILEEERKSLEAQIAEYKVTLQMHEMGKSNLSDFEITSMSKIYQHLMVQKQELDKQIIRFDRTAAERFSRDEDKERVIKMLVQKYSDTLK